MKEPLGFSWEGSLADLKDQYSSVELQHEAMQSRIDSLLKKPLKVPEFKPLSREEIYRRS